MMEAIHVHIAIAICTIAKSAVRSKKMKLTARVVNATSIVAMIVDCKDTDRDRDNRIAQNASNEFSLYWWMNCKKKMIS